MIYVLSLINDIKELQGEHLICLTNKIEIKLVTKLEFH
jgi:hypothetical protein